MFPVPGDRVSCGLRTDLPKADRVHKWVSLGIDSRHMNDGAFEDMEVFACAECGRDKQKRVI